MQILKGKAVSGGIVIGKLYFYHRTQPQIRRYHVDDTDAEVIRFENAKMQAIEQMRALYEKALEDVGEADAMIFQIHQMMLEDLDYCESITSIIKKERVNAEYAVGITADNFSQMFSSMGDNYMKERATDVKDVSEKLIKILLNSTENVIASDEPVIVAADDLMPSETVQMDRNKLLGFVTMQGSENSHTAILARTMNIPAVINTGDQIKPEYDGLMTIVDGYEGQIYINPDEATIREFKAKQEQCLKKAAILKQLKGKDNCTLDGQHIDIYANVDHVANCGMAVQNDAGGIGLFRSEFVYLERNTFPTEDEQFEIYKTVAQKMEGKKVIIRTMDIGADKQAAYFNIPKEENPAMGYRAIRICLDKVDIFKTQLRAIYRASVFGKLAVMFPMITSLHEVLQIKEIVKQVKAELEEQGFKYDEVETGIMIETPAAAIISDILAKEVEFFSIGTNDLVQYTLAMDRQNHKLSNIYNPYHKAVLRLIKMVVDNGHANGIWVGICGELAGDLSLTETFLAMGIDELSVSPSKVLEVRKKVRETNVSANKADILREIGR